MDVQAVRRYQLAQMELMDVTDRVCEELGITYYLIGGTLLGAVRHGGFIPWDADMDIAMKRADYEKFRQYWTTSESPRYFYQDHTTERNHLSPHAILRIKGTHVVMKGRKTDKYQPANDGIYLDIFPLDEPPAEKKLQEKQMKQIRNIKRIIELKAAYTYGAATSPLKRIAKKCVQLLLSPVTLPMLNKRLHAVMMRHNGSGSGYLVSMASHYSYWKQLMKQEIYGTPARIAFEDRMYLAPASPDAYLTQLYRDYMKLPPEDKRFSDLDMIDHIDYGDGVTE